MINRKGMNHRAMWLWLAGRPGKSKMRYLLGLGLTKNDMFRRKKGAPINECFLCDKYECFECPLDIRWHDPGIDIPGCLLDDSHFARWTRGMMATPINRHMLHIHAMRLSEAETWSGGRYTS